eukprot:TRINITY_DN4254_c0_g1_i1.p1 TRINITY_DN4254_c0_g1~~TRINITY_DN4254_c0_g1_i1.p1  ORF type:complete len:255 (-),score=23.44 TRINITY_DN4254_c0_g1_i1:31-795(-)
MSLSRSLTRKFFYKNLTSRKPSTNLKIRKLTTVKPKIIYKTLEPALVGKAMDCISTSFVDNYDPFTKALGLSQTQWGIMSSMFVSRAAELDLSFVAVDSQTGRVEGVLINEDWKQPPPKFYHQLDDWRPVRAIFNELHTRYKAISPRIEYGKVIHPLYFTCVRPDSRRKGIVTTLWEKSILLARERNFEKMVAEGSTALSGALFTKKLGFKEVVSVSLKDFKFEGKTIFHLEDIDPAFGRLSIFERHIPSDLYF